MKELIFYTCLILLAIVSFEDYKYRAVTWILFPSLFICFFFLSIQGFSFTVVMENVSFNFFFLFLILVLTTIYFSFKNKRLVNISNGFLGWGDILFLFSISVLFSPVNYILFYVGSLFIITLIYSLNKLLKKLSEEKIPLAGLQAFLLIGLMLFNKFFPFMDFSSDEWIFKAYLND